LNDKDYMSLAISLAKKGAGSTNPNPMVGAVVVKNDKVIGSGYHQRYGELHAERNALSSCVENPSGATLYVTLEPCCHYGKTPPCTEAIIESHIAKVVIGSKDPNPLVAGKGIEILRKSGIEVIEDFMKEDCDDFNRIFFHYITTGTPYVTMKYAMTMDGKIATISGDSKWITCEASRQRVHVDRGRNMAIMVGIGTVIKDDPILTCRFGDGTSPIRIICDTNLITPLNSKVVTDSSEGRLPRTIIATSVKGTERYRPYSALGVEILTVPKDGEHLDLLKLMKMLGDKGIDSIMLEGGSTLNWSALNTGIVQRIQAYIAPKLFGGAAAKTPIGGSGITIATYAYKLVNPKIIQIEDDVMIESEVISCSQE